MQPRFFWRRAFAFLADMTLVSLLTFALLLPLHMLAPNHVAPLKSLFTAKQCILLPEPPKAFAETIPAGYFSDNGPIYFYQCRISAYFITESFVGAAFTVEREEGSMVTKTKRLTRITNERGEPLNALDPSDIVIALFVMFGFAYFLRNKNGQTPGKRIFGLQVVAESPEQPLSFKRYLARETLRNIFFVGQGLLTLIAFLSYQIGSNHAFFAAIIVVFADMGVFSALWIAFLATLVIWYFLPLLRWRGQMQYDRLTGFEVIRPLGGEIEKAAWFK